MRILYIWDADYPWDVRVEKICQSLHRHGYGVHIAARNLKRLPIYENIEGLHIHRLKTWKKEKLNYVLSFPVFFSPIWRLFLDSIIHQNKIDLIIVRDLPMAIAGIWAGNRNKIPVIFDMAEDYPAMVRDIWLSSKFQGMNLFIRNPYLARIVEKAALKYSSHIFVVIEESKNRLVNENKIDPNKITIIRNTPVKSCVKLKKYDRGNKRRIVYVGGIQMGRGIQFVLDAIPFVVSRFDNFEFLVIGDGYAKGELMKLADESGVVDYVKWLGFIDNSKIESYLAGCDLGIIPHFVTDHTNTTIPNKLFEYMKSGLPIVASNSFPMERIIEGNCGLIFKSGNVRDLANKIIELLSKEDLEELGENGRRLFEEKYNWDKDGSEMLKAINSIIRRLSNDCPKIFR